MLKWALVVFVVAIAVGALALGGVAGTAGGVALGLFWLFLAVTVILFLVGLVTGRRPSI